MADASDFPPGAGPPPAEKSQLKVIDRMNLDDLQSTVGVYVLLGNGGAYMYKGSAHDLRKRVTDHMQGRKWLKERYAWVAEWSRLSVRSGHRTSHQRRVRISGKILFLPIQILLTES